ncbi:MAG: ABC-type antimicrobial peptide transport system, ATPase component [Halonotius sp. J07HN4]|nr:MAG: ABC-type antimicrobial peptide transport system, ATPase component [Halonotius sp. J07HN4]
MSETAATEQSAAPTADDPTVVVEEVSKHYTVGSRVTALDSVSLTLDPGSYTAIMGPSGSGKSTLLNLIGGLDTPSTGDVTVDGKPVSTADEDERAAIRGTDIGFVFQTFNLMPRLTAVENVALPLVFDGWSPAERTERAVDRLQAVGLGDRTDHVPNELSGGQRQRVAIARALAPDPALILADEPTGNVDTDTGATVLDLFDDLHGAGNTILLVTHEPHVAERADRIIHVEDGEIREIEATGEA